MPGRATELLLFAMVFWVAAQARAAEPASGISFTFLDTDQGPVAMVNLTGKKAGELMAVVQARSGKSGADPKSIHNGTAWCLLRPKDSGGEEAECMLTIGSEKLLPAGKVDAYRSLGYRDPGFSTATVAKIEVVGERVFISGSGDSGPMLGYQRFIQELKKRKSKMAGAISYRDAGKGQAEFKLALKPW